MMAFQTMSVAEFSKHVNIGIDNLYNIVKIEGFPVLRIGRNYLIVVDEAENWLREQSKTGRKF